MHGRMDPLWNSIVIGGVQDGKPFLGTVGMLGVQFADEHIATGGSLRVVQCSSASPCAMWMPVLAKLPICVFCAVLLGASGGSH